MMTGYFIDSLVWSVLGFGAGSLTTWMTLTRRYPHR